MFPFFSHVQVFSWEISLVSNLKYQYSYFSSHFCLLIIFVLLMLLLSVLFLISGFYKPSSGLYTYIVFLNAFFYVIFSLLFLTYTICFTSSLGCKTLCIIMSFLDLRSICWISSLVHFKNSPENLTRGTVQVFIPLMRYLLWIWLWVVFSFPLFFLSFPHVQLCLLPIFPSNCRKSWFHEVFYLIWDPFF